MKYTIDTEKKTIEFTSLSSSEIIELAKQYKGFTFICKPAVISITGGTVYPIYNSTDINLCGTSSGKYDLGLTTNHCQGGNTLNYFSGTLKCGHSN
jgi:hypothetical protein